MNVLELVFDDEILSDWIEYISSILHLTTVSEINIEGLQRSKDKQIKFEDIGRFLHGIGNLTSLQISTGLSMYEHGFSVSEYCSMIPLHVKHLAIPIRSIDQSITILERFNHLSTVQFILDRRIAAVASEQLENWLDENRNGSQLSTEYLRVYVWIGKQMEKSTNKRRKLSRRSDS